MKKVFIRTFGWPLVTVARDGAGGFAKDKRFGMKKINLCLIKPAKND